MEVRWTGGWMNRWMGEQVGGWIDEYNFNCMIIIPWLS